MGSKQQYIHNVATSVLGQIGGVTYGGSDQQDWYETDEEKFPQSVWQQYGVKIIGVVHRMGPSARGRIADCGVGPSSPSGSLSYKVFNEGGGFEGMIDGSQALTLLASYVVTAAIVDIIRADVRKMREERAEADDERWGHELMEEQGRGIYGSMVG